MQVGEVPSWNGDQSRLRVDRARAGGLRRLRRGEASKAMEVDRSMQVTMREAGHGVGWTSK